MKRYKVYTPVRAYIVKIVEAENGEEAIDKATFPIWSPKDFEYDGGRMKFSTNPDIGGSDYYEMEEEEEDD